MLFLLSVPSFEASRYLITNREFLEFVKDGGYQNRALWTDEGDYELFGVWPLWHLIVLLYKQVSPVWSHYGFNQIYISVVLWFPHNPSGWQWVQFRQAAHPTFWVCHKKCKSGCGSDLTSYSHCTLPAPPATADSDQCTYKYGFESEDQLIM